jgi:hypothetical protein
LLGSGYCLWLVQLIYALKADRKRFGIEFFFFGLFAVLAVLVLILGFSLSYIDHAYFYYFYANGIGFSFILITGALLAFPEMLNELSERVTRSYAKVLLLGEPDSSVLAISLETGFKSQSNFYAAFKEITNQSPGQYRKANSC